MRPFDLLSLPVGRDKWMPEHGFKAIKDTDSDSNIRMPLASDSENLAASSRQKISPHESLHKLRFCPPLKEGSEEEVEQFEEQ